MKKNNTTYAPTIGSNGLVKYSEPVQLETIAEKKSREVFWRSIGKKIRNGSRIK